MPRLKILFLLLPLIAIICLGCGSNNNHTYGYRWTMSGTTTSATSNAITKSSGQIYCDNVPVVASVAINGEAMSCADVYVYEKLTDGSIQYVKASWVLNNPNYGEILPYEHTEEMMRIKPTQVGITDITATVGTESITIPVYIYRGVGLNVNTDWGGEPGYDFENETWSNDLDQSDIYIDTTTGEVQTAGWQMFNSVFSVALTAPEQGYSAANFTPEVGKTYWIKTRNEQYAKIHVGFNGNGSGYFIGFLYSKSTTQQFDK